MVIRPQDRVARVLARDERLLDVFTAASPHFARLRDPRMRRVMARLVTVEQAARIAGVDPAALVERLNRAVVEGSPGPTVPPPATPAVEEPELLSAIPEPLRSLSPERIVELDVREELRAGEEPFSRIMAAVRQLPDTHVLRLRAIFEPVPLYGVLGRQGFAHHTERLAEDDWRVCFFQAPAEQPGSGTTLPDPQTLPGKETGGEGSEVVVLDVRGLEPPEPMVRTLEALQSLPTGKTLVQLNVRIPQFLLPRLEELGYSYEVREQGDDLVRLFIRRR